jgi:hypothetical protein
MGRPASSPLGSWERGYARGGVGVGKAILAEVVLLETARGIRAVDVSADVAAKSFLEEMSFRTRLLVKHRWLAREPAP